jgi:hypothetical protein
MMRLRCYLNLRSAAGSLIVATALVAACARPGGVSSTPSEGKQEYDLMDFPTLGYGYGHQTHLLFSFEGTEEQAGAMRWVSESGISEDPRVQHFVDVFRKCLRQQGYVHDPIRWQEESALGYLSEVTYSGGLRLADAEIEVRERNGKPEKYYRWRGMHGDWVAGAFLDELGVRIRATSSLAIVYGRQTPSGGYTDFLQFNVAAHVVGNAAVNPLRDGRNAQLYKYGVMGIIAPRDSRAIAPSYVHNVVITVSSMRGGAATTIDGIVSEALNLALTDDEVVYFYPNASLNAFADSDERVQYYARTVTKAIVMEANPSLYRRPWD